MGFQISPLNMAQCPLRLFLSIFVTFQHGTQQDTISWIYWGEYWLEHSTWGPVHFYESCSTRQELRKSKRWLRVYSHKVGLPCTASQHDCPHSPLADAHIQLNPLGLNTLFTMQLFLCNHSRHCSNQLGSNVKSAQVWQRSPTARHPLWD